MQTRAPHIKPQTRASQVKAQKQVWLSSDQQLHKEDVQSATQGGCPIRPDWILARVYSTLFTLDSNPPSPPPPPPKKKNLTTSLVHSAYSRLTGNWGSCGHIYQHCALLWNNEWTLSSVQSPPCTRSDHKPFFPLLLGSLDMLKD